MNINRSQELSMNSTLVFVFLFLPSASIFAEIIVDGSSNENRQQISIQPLPDPASGNINRYTIDENLGKREGNNLFHSFSTFNVKNGENAHFTSRAETKNIFARVTGGDPSEVNGIISTSKHNTASLWLMNPKGWIIGEGAEINVQGAFHLSSANGIGFGNGSMFFADTKSKSVLSAASPIDYQFNGAIQAEIKIDKADVVMPEKQNITILGGDIIMTDSTLRAPGGLIVLASNSGVGRWEIDAGLTQNDGKGGLISIHNTEPSLLKPSISSSDPLSKNSSGGIQMTAEKIHLTNATILGQARDKIASDSDSAGDTILKATEIHLTTSFIRTEVLGVENAGQLQIIGQNLILDNGSKISSDTNIGSTGRGGDILIDLTGDMILSKQSGITSTVLGNDGDGGNICLKANTVLINDSSFIDVETHSNPNAGNITIHANQLNMKNEGRLSSSTRLSSDTGRGGNGGDIVVITNSMSLKKNTLISSESQGYGSAGNIHILTDDLSIINDSKIRAGSTASGATGVIILEGLPLKLNEGEICTLADPTNSEYIKQNIGTLLIDHSSIITSAKQGDGGNISVDTKRLVMNGGFIQANASSENSQGGEIILNAGVTLASQGKILDNEDKRQDFNPNSSVNVIQAVAEKGVNGPITLNTDEINIAGQLAKVDSNFVVRQSISHDPCNVARNKQTSSLIQKGQGGLPSNAGDNIRLPLHRYRSKETPKPQTGLDPANKKTLPHSIPGRCKKRKN